MKEKKNPWVLALLNRLEGDKVIWMILMMLVLISVVCMFSSSSRLLEGGRTRVDIVRTQLMVVAGGLGIVLILYNIRSIEFFRKVSFWMLPVSLSLLLALRVLPAEGSICAPNINGAHRVIEIAGKQIHVLEIAKIAMVLYLGWALDAFKNKRIRWPYEELWQSILYIYLPFVAVFVLVLLSSNSAAIMIGGIMFLVILLGGGSKRDLGVIIAAAIVLVFICFGIYKISGGKYCERIGTGISRIFDRHDWERQFLENPRNSTAYNEAKDHLQQGYSAKIAIHEGGILGKGPGQSTQRYIVPDMPSDYMYSFIVEEYGLWGAILVLSLYVSLMARGAIIARDIGDSLYAKLVVAGLCLLIVGQAFLHMLVNIDIGPMTGQTLPMISHGNFAFLCFSVAFGILLSFSRQARKRIATETAKATPIIEDPVRFEKDEL
ncbi:MAG: FtsW/RodA/SpoVE family cell cycle protein [Bacteroidales bacterium]|nr:FtsW/RodA/SpoVE family cell cycle protein [Bacteroidales bacterium]